MNGVVGDSRGKGASGHVSLFGRRPVPTQPAVRLDLQKGREIFGQPMELRQTNPARVWESLSAVTLDADHLAGNCLFPAGATDPAAAAFDMLRTRILQALAERGWSRIAVTSPTHGCGKSLVAANLALSLARHPQGRTVLMDMDLRRPSLGAMLGLTDLPPLAEFLRGDQPLESHFRRFGRTLALGLNGQPVAQAAELLHDPATGDALDALHQQLDPTVVLYDTPPALACDDLMAMGGQLDAVLLVTDGTRTSPEDIRACERLFNGHLPILGVVLNRAQDRRLARYRYGSGRGR